MTSSNGRMRTKNLLEELGFSDADLAQWEGTLFIVKAGGDVLESGTATILDDVKLLAHHGARVALVYGAQNELNRQMRHYGLEPQFVGGLRITDAATMGNVYIPVMTKRGEELAAYLSGELLTKSICAERMEEFGYVGKVTYIDGEVTDHLANGKVVVISPLVKAREGKGYGPDDVLNCNADNVACAMAYNLMPEGTYLATNVPGVIFNGRLQPSLGYERGRILVSHGYVSDGMEQKVLQAGKAIERGAKHITIFDGTEPHNLFYAMQGKAGTKLYDPLAQRPSRVPAAQLVS